MNNGFTTVISNLGAFLLYLFVVLLPWQARYIATPKYINEVFWEYASVSIYALDVLLLSIVVLALLYAKELVVQNIKKPLLIVIGISMYLLIVLTFSPFKETAQFASMLLILIPLLFYTLAVLPWNKRYMLWALFIAGVWSGALGVYQFFTGEVAGSTFLGMSAQLPGDLGVSVIETEHARFLRAYGSLSHPNMLGGLLVISIFAGLTIVRLAKTRIERGIIISGILFLSFALFFTFSRSSFLALVFGLIVAVASILYTKDTINRKIIIWSVMSIMVVIGIQSVLFSDLVRSRFSTNRLETQSITERTDSFAHAQEFLWERPFFGSGFHTYTEVLAQKDSFASPAWSYQPVHNIDLLILVETGFVGMLIVLSGAIFYLRSLLKERYIWEECLFFGMLVSLAVISLFDHFLLTSHFGLLLIVVILSLPFKTITPPLTKSIQIL